MNWFIPLLIMSPVEALAQPTEFLFTNTEITDFVVRKCPDKTQQELYQKTLQWIEVTFKSPKEVLKAQIENEFIRLEGTSMTAVCTNIYGEKNHETKFSIEISFKDGRYKFDLTELKFYIPPFSTIPGSWQEVNLNSPAEYYNSKGNPKPGYKCLPASVSTFFNNLNKSLAEFIASKNLPSKKDEW